MAILSGIHFKPILRTLGAVWIFTSAFMLLSLGWSIYYQDGCWKYFIISMVISMLTGFILQWNNRGRYALGIKDSFVIVTLSWLTVAFWGALPSFLSGAIPSFTDAYFESMSGFTTTGASILRNVEIIPKGILFQRSLNHWLGGMGIILMTIVILPLLGIGGMQLFRAEVPGGPISDKMTPRIKETARVLWGVYLFFTVLETILLLLGGMNLFESLCHSFGSMATGGFSTRNASIGAYSPYIQWVITVFMIIAGCNFALYFRLLLKDFKGFLQDNELQFYIGIILVSSLLIIIFNYSHLFESFNDRVRHTIFQVASIMTTTGYITHDYELWPHFSQFMLLLLMFVGGMAGSTGGGIKVMRFSVMLKLARMEIRQHIHPKGIFPIRMGKRIINNDIVKTISGFVFIYLLLFICGAIILTMHGLDIVTSIGASAASINNIGPGLGLVGPVDNYSQIPIIGKWVLTGLMLMGRLEVYTVIVLFTRSFWRK